MSAVPADHRGGTDLDSHTEARAVIVIAVVMRASLYPAAVAIWMWMLFQGTARAADKAGGSVAAATGLVKPTLCFLKLVPNSKRTKVGVKVEESGV